MKNSTIVPSRKKRPRRLKRMDQLRVVVPLDSNPIKNLLFNTPLHGDIARITAEFSRTQFSRTQFNSTITAGEEHSLFLVEGGAVLSCGDDNYGQLGQRLRHGETTLIKPELINALGGWRIMQVAAGTFQSLFLTQSGKVLSCGIGDSGQLGHGDEENRSTPELIKALDDRCVAQVATGSHHSLFLTKDRKVFSCGRGCIGQLGHDDEENRSTPELIKALEGQRIVQVAAGGYFSLFVTEDGKVFSCGDGYNGQLGHGNRENQHVPKLIESLKDRTVVQVAACTYHSLFLTEDGKVFSCGKGHFGQLGHGDKDKRLTPELINALGGWRIMQVAAGHFHSLFLTQGGAVLSCGEGFVGQLGHGDKEELLTPELIEALDNRRVAQVATGSYHSLFLTKDGEVFSCGRGTKGRLGHGINIQKQFLPLKIHFPTKNKKKEMLDRLIKNTKYTKIRDLFLKMNLDKLKEIIKLNKLDISTDDMDKAKKTLIQIYMIGQIESFIPSSPTYDWSNPGIKLLLISSEISIRKTNGEKKDKDAIIHEIFEAMKKRVAATSTVPPQTASASIATDPDGVVQRNNTGSGGLINQMAGNWRSTQSGGGAMWSR